MGKLGIMHQPSEDFHRIGHTSENSFILVKSLSFLNLSLYICWPIHGKVSKLGLQQKEEAEALRGQGGRWPNELPGLESSGTSLSGRLSSVCRGRGRAYRGSRGHGG